MKKQQNNEYDWLEREAKRCKERIATHLEYDNWFWK